MKLLKVILFLSLFFNCQPHNFAQSADLVFPKGVIYIHPNPGTGSNSPAASIIIKFKENEIHHVTGLKFEIKDSAGNLFGGELVRSGNSFCFTPLRNFPDFAEIFVELKYLLNGRNLEYQFRFRTSEIPEIDESVCEFNSASGEGENILAPKSQTVRVIKGVSVPNDFPALIFQNYSADAASGKVFINNRSGSSYLAVYEQNGRPYFYKKVETGSRDFCLQSNGMLTRFTREHGWKYLGMNDQLEVVDTFRAANGYSTDDHELTILPNGNYFLIARSARLYPLVDTTQNDTTWLNLGENNIQEFDKHHNLVFEWMSQNFFKFEDAYAVSQSGKKIDYIHMNSISVDYDSNIVVSCRNLSEVTKINRQTGEIIWRLGGKNNQFKFLNEPYEFSYQHDARPVPGKPNHYTIFDNGNYRTPYFSRVVEYMVDTSAMTAQKVWEQRREPDAFSSFMGNAQRLPNGNTLINWAVSAYPKLDEYTPDHRLVQRADFDRSNYSYRTYKYQWESTAEKPYLLYELYDGKVNLIFNKFGDESVTGYVIYSGMNSHDLQPVDSTENPYYEFTDLHERGIHYFEVCALDSSGSLSLPSNLIEVPVDAISPGGNLIKNSSFASGLDFWFLEIDSTAIAVDTIDADSSCWIKIEDGGSDYGSVKLVQTEIPLFPGKEYTLEIEAAAAQSKIVEINLERQSSPFTDYSKLGFQSIGTQMRKYIFKFEMHDQTDVNARLVLNLGASDSDVFLKGVSLREIVQTGVVPERKADGFRIIGNYPNPFNPETTIEFSLGKKRNIFVEIFSPLGERIKTVYRGELNRGVHRLKWNGTSDDNESVGSGVYFCRIRNGEYFRTIKVMLLR